MNRIRTCLVDQAQTSEQLSARRIILSGTVQGVGFRPFIYRLAIKHQLVGWVKNCLGTVEILVQGQARNIELFVSDIFDNSPLLAKPKLESLSLIHI